MRTQEQIVQDLRAGEYDLVGVIDAVVDLHGIIGVGRYTLADHVGAYIRTRKGTIPAGGVPVLVVVSGGVARPYAQEPARVVVVDRDDIDAGEECPVLPAGVGFEALCKAAGIEAGEVEFKDKEWTVDAPRQHTLSTAQDVLGDLFKGIDDAIAGGKQCMDELPDAEKGSTKAAKRRNAIAELTAVRDALAVEELDIEDACHHGPQPPRAGRAKLCMLCVE